MRNERENGADSKTKKHENGETRLEGWNTGESEERYCCLYYSAMLRIHEPSTIKLTK